MGPVWENHNMFDGLVVLNQDNVFVFKTLNLWRKQV